MFDSELSMKSHSHISKTASACFFHLRRLRQLRGVVTYEVMKQLVTSLVLSRLDYCNSELFGLPASTLAPLQRVQNVAARLVLRLDHRADIKHALQRLHWLPVKARIQFKIATVMHAILNQRGPAIAYLNNIIKFNREESGRRHASPFLYNQRSCCHDDTDPVHGKRAFSVCGPSIWNQIPPHIRNLHSVPAFRKALKTYLFSEII